MKRSICLFLCACLLTAVLPAFAAGVSDVMCVTNCKEWVSLREYPDSSSKRLAQVRLGELVTDCTAAYNDFVQCEFNGKVGYIQHQYLKMTDYSSGESFPGNQMVVNVTEWASMWSEPSTSSTRVVRVPVGSIVTSCVGTTGGFILCEYTSGKKVYKGYISTSYLKKANYNATKQDQKAVANAMTEATGLEMIVVNCNDWVSLREKASASAARLAKVPLGAKVENCVQYNADFVYCSYRGLYGYIQAQYLSESEANEPPYEPDPVTPVIPVIPEQPTAVVTTEEIPSFSSLPELPDYQTMLTTGTLLVRETYQGYTMLVSRLYNDYEEMLGVCYDLNEVPLWRIYVKSPEEVYDVRQLDAFVAGTLDDPQLIWYVKGTGLFSYAYGATQRLRWFLPAESLGIDDTFAHTEDYDGTFYIAFGDVLLRISRDGQLMWRTKCNVSSLFWPTSIEIDESGISVLYDNHYGMENMYDEARFSPDGSFLYTTQRQINNEA